jgi:UDP-hydrolysing UDP-N-acetyl-D-glucosamine 2-epimerase
MKTIIFPATNRVHLARQQLLLKELRKVFNVVVVKSTLSAVEDYVKWFKEVLKNNEGAVLIRGDRFEMLPLAMVSAYAGRKVIHIEGGDLSGAIDNKVRHAITQLADIHFATTEESQQRIIQMGISPSKVFNFGSLDCEYANSIKKEPHTGKPFILVAHHPLEGEYLKEIDKGLEFWQGDIVWIKSNQDEGRQYGQEEYPPEKYINLLNNASCLVGNSSSFLKEASIFGTPVVNLGNRQQKRLKPRNVLDVPEIEAKKIESAIKYQLKQCRYQLDPLYYQPGTSDQICQQIKKFLD